MQATGNLGPAIQKALVDAGFKVTVFTRKDSTKEFPPSVTKVPVDYESVDALTSALKGQDAIVSTLNATATDAQLNLVKAAAAAGVQRFIPSEFGSNTANEKAANIPIFKGSKVVVQDALKNQALSSGLSYSLIATGPFLDWGLQIPFLMNIKGKSVTLYDGGKNTFSATTLADVGQGVVGVLKNLDATKNRIVYTQSAATNLNQLLAYSKNAVGADGWTETPASTEEVYQRAFENLTGDSPNPEVFLYGFIHAAIFGEGYGSHFPKTDNELLGIKELSENELQELVKNVAK